MKHLLLFLVVIFCANSLLFSQAAGIKRYVAVQTTPVKNSTGFFARNLGNLTLGTEVILVRESGKWSEVRTVNLSGWVASSSLTARRLVSSTAIITANEVAMAGKGFSPDTEAEYKRNGMDYTMVDAMERINVPINELSEFITEGRLARGE
jgi:SH3-like domain-containing protein